MRILFSGVPAFGHLLPLLPLARAAEEAGHSVALLTSSVMTESLTPFQVLPSGPGVDVLIAEVARRTGAADPLTETIPALTAEIRVEAARRTAGGAPVPTGPSMNAELFAGTRVDLTIDEALANASGYAPDLVVTESADRVGPMVAAALGVPWVEHATVLDGAMGGAIATAMDATVASRYDARGLSPTPRLAALDPFPDLLQLPGRRPGPDVLAIQPAPYARAGVNWVPPSFPSGAERPTVLLTLGTVIDDPALLAGMSATVEAIDVNLIVAMSSQEKANAFVADRTRVAPVGFVPMEQLLQGVDVVISAGGAGTVLASLSMGLPMVISPMIAEQPVNAAQVAAAGAGITATDPKHVGPMVQRILTDPSFTAAARRVAEQIASMSAPDQVLQVLTGRMTQAV